MKLNKLMGRSSGCIFGKAAAAAAVAASVAGAAYGSGFALYEGSTAGTALGGGVMGKAVDASANFYNPATLSDFTNTVITVGFLTEHPTMDYTVDGRHGRKMDPGGFMLPHFMVAQPLGYGFTFGFGIAPEYGLGSHYHKSWDLNWDTRSTTIKGISFNPNLSYEITEDWSVAAGFRIMFFSFEQYSEPTAAANGAEYGAMRSHIDADNNFADWGWQIGTRYKILDNLSVGLLYKSYIDTKIRGTQEMSIRRRDYSAAYSQADAMAAAAVAPYAGTPFYDAALAQAQTTARATAKNTVDSTLKSAAKSHTGHGGADIRLPQSLTLGLNWDITDTLHFGTAVSWTQWSSLQKIDFDLPGGQETVPLKFDDTIRAGGGFAWDFHENFTAMASYVYDQNACSHYHNSTMLPPGDRHIATFGLAWHWRNWRVDACYGVVYMAGESTFITNRQTGERHKFDTHDGKSRSAGLSVTYFF